MQFISYCATGIAKWPYVNTFVADKIYMAKYFFTTVWKVNAPKEAVWEIIKNVSDWPMWWHGVVEVQKIKEGDTDGLNAIYKQTWKSRLPYKLIFITEATWIEPFNAMEGKASGDLDGTGRWEFYDDGNGWTTVTYFWNVKTNVTWMNALAPVLNIVFKWNHDAVMNWGGMGIGKKLNCKVLFQ